LAILARTCKIDAVSATGATGATGAAAAGVVEEAGVAFCR